MTRGQLAVADAPLDCWWVAATTDEVTAALLPRRLLGTSVLLYRRRSGDVVALEDRCAHRQLPLSLGSLADDDVVCRYHGFRYGPDGGCVAVPSQANVPYGLGVRSFPVREQGPFVWVWLGRPGRAGVAPPPAVPELVEPGWSVLGGTGTVAANYLLLHENALDRTHFAFVHPDTTHRGYLTEPPPVRVERTETSVSYARTFPAGPLTGWQCAATGLSPDAGYVQHESGVFVSPALHVDRMSVDGGAGDCYRTAFVRAFTPVDVRTTRVHWLVARDFADGDPAVAEALRRVHERTMAEDQPLLEAIQADVDRDGPRRVANAAADIAAVSAHAIIERLLREQARPSAGVRPAG